MAGAVVLNASAAVTLPAAESLPASLEHALQAKQPLVVMVSLHGCAFCKVVQVDMRDNRALLDFDGISLTHDAWVRKQGIKLAPTVLFFWRSGA